MQMVVPENSVYYLEIVTPDVEAVCDLYTRSHGWEFQPANPELGNACVASLPDASLCGVRAPMHPTEKPIVRTYLAVTDIHGCVQKAAEMGGKILLECLEMPGHGIIAIYEHGGIEQGLWQVQ